MELCGICGVHLESMGEGKVHVMGSAHEGGMRKCQWKKVEVDWKGPIHAEKSSQQSLEQFRWSLFHPV
jgi:hypothetical protein